MADIIKVEHLSYVYNPGMPNAVTALDDVSFTVEEGDFVGIIGATGSGKSTLITHMNGLNKPTSGKIYIDGRDLWEDPEKIRDFRFLTGLVFQYPEYQLFEETCYKDIAFGPKNMGLDEAEIDRRVHEAADFVGLDPALLERSPFELSGGQKRRVAVAGVMAMKPRILVLDEPAAGLDPEGRDDILSEVKEYHKKTGTTVLLVSHSMEDIAKYANRVLVMSNKKIAMYDTVEKVFARAPELLELGLSVPQVTKIAQVAVRDFSESEAALAASSGRIATFDDLSLAAALFRGETWDAQCRRIVDALPQEVYVSFDIDALTFENCPHTGTPVSGGLTFNQAVWLLDTLTRSGRRIIGFDVVEVCPAPDERIDAITGARMLWKLCGQTLKSNES